MDGATLALIVLVAGGFLIILFILARLSRRLREIPRDDPSAGLLVLQNQLDGLREQVRSSLEGGRLEIDRKLEETNRVVGQVRQGLGAVDRQVQSVTEVARDLSKLQELLRSPKIRGGMGEHLLAELLAQVLPQAAFSLQYGFPGGERVDAVIRLGERLVPVDAKFPLDNYRKLTEAETDAERRGPHRAFRADVRKHVDDIARRYIRPGDGTYDFALMYMPAEAVYRQAFLEQGDDGLELQDYALARRVVPVSPQSFYAYLQVIVLGLRGLSIEARAEEIMDRLGTIRRRLDQFTDSFEVAGKHMGNAQRQLDEARRRLERLDAALEEVERGDGETAAAPAQNLQDAPR